jgi:hypothetical protein
MEWTKSFNKAAFALRGWTYENAPQSVWRDVDAMTRRFGLQYARFFERSNPVDSAKLLTNQWWDLLWREGGE